MRLTRRDVLAGGSATGLMACTGPVVSPAKPIAAQYDFRLGPNGILIPALNQRIDFERAEPGAIAAMSKLLGADPAAPILNAECGAGPVRTLRWASGFEMLFQAGDFRGWVSRDPKLRTQSGLAAGLSRGQVEGLGVGAFRQTGLGVEFELDGIFGLIAQHNGKENVDLLWAGASCFFR